MTYHLNKKWKLLIVGGGFFCCAIGLGLLTPIIVSSLSTSDIRAILIVSLFFELAGIELIYEGIKTKIDVFEDGIVYHQSRYIFSAKWHDLQSIIPMPGTLILRFSETKKICGGIAYIIAKAMKSHSTLAINYYLTDENRAYIRERIIAGKELKDEDELRFLQGLI